MRKTNVTNYKSYIISLYERKIKPKLRFLRDAWAGVVFILCLFYIFIEALYKEYKWRLERNTFQDFINNPLSEISYRLIEYSVCQNFTSVEMTGTVLNSNFPVAISLSDIDAHYTPFITDIYSNYAPIGISAFFLAVFIALLVTRRNAANKAVFHHKFIVLSPLVISIITLLMWLSLIVIDSQITKYKNPENFVNYSAFIRIVAKVIYPFDTLDNPAIQLNSNIALIASVKALKNDDSIAAAKCAEFDHYQKTVQLRENITLLVARQFYELKDFERAAFYADKAYDLTGSDKAFIVQQKSRAMLAIDLGARGHYGLAQNELIKLDKDWNDQLKDSAWIAVFESFQQKQANKNPSDLRNKENIEILGKHLSFFSKHNPGRVIPAKLQCYFALSLENMFNERLDSGNIEAAIQVIRPVQQLISNYSSENELIAKHYVEDAVTFFEKHELDKTLSLFEAAQLYLPNNETIQCNRASIHMLKGKDFAEIGQFVEADVQANTAGILCESQAMDMHRADISIIKGKWFMRHGDLESARKNLSQVKKNKTPDRYKIAAMLEKDTYQSPKRLSMIDNARSWEGHIPKITGSLCSFEDDNDCAVIAFYDGERQIGKGFADMKIVELNDVNTQLILSDSRKRGFIDRAEFTESKNRHVVIEADGDNIIDTKSIFNEKGENVLHEQYSGKILAKVQGVIGKSEDILSDSDSYLVVKKSNTYIGHTSVEENTQFPIYKEGFSIHLKKGEHIYISMWDKDLVYDDLIDNFIFTSLPQSDIYAGLKNKARIAVTAIPTTLPEGTYYIKPVEQSVNVFRYLSFANTDPKTQEVINQAKHTEETSDLRATVASYVIPEAIIWTLFAEQNIATQFLMGVLGTDTTYDILRNKEKELSSN